MVVILGFIGALAFGVSAIPLAYDTHYKGRSHVSILGILLIIMGSSSMFLYELLTSSKIFSLLDFAICALCWLLILKYRLFPRGPNEYH